MNNQPLRIHLTVFSIYDDKIISPKRFCKTKYPVTTPGNLEPKNGKEETKTHHGKKGQHDHQSYMLLRMLTVSPRYSECYYFRMLLNVGPGPTSLDYFKSFEGTLSETYLEACENDNLHTAQQENCSFDNPSFTEHRPFWHPANVINRGTALDRMIRDSKAIIIDVATILHRSVLEVLNCTLQNIT